MIHKRRSSDEQPEASLDDLLQQPAPDQATSEQPAAEQPVVAADDTIQIESVDAAPYADASPYADATSSVDALPPMDSGSGDGFLDDDDFLPQERRRPSRLTVSLVAVLVLGVGIVGGIWIQKQFGAQTSAAAGFPGGGQGFPGGGQGMPGGGQGMPSGSGRGGFPGGGQGMPGGGSMPSGAPDQAPNGGGGGGSAANSETPVVVGTVTKLKTDQLVVEDLGGKSHDVTVTESTTVTVPFKQGELKTGDTVSITGSTTGDQVTASTITVR